jgi:ADP-L-glycero-D-manno-heptose 6-epimerase
LRDFVWVGDCVRAALWTLQDPTAPSGLYNVGSGTARSFLDQAKIVFNEMGVEPNIEFVDLPANLRGKYQYYTCADMRKFRAAGFACASTTLEEGLRRYVHGYVEAEDSFC